MHRHVCTTVRAVAAVCRSLARVSIRNGTTAAALPVVELALAHYGAAANVLTPIHATFVQLCLHAKAYTRAAAVLDTPIYDVGVARESGITVAEVLLYHYYGGMVYCGLKRWRDAANLLKTVLAVPATAVSAISVEAYKKYALASLLAHGSLPALPKYTPPVLARQLSVLAAPYFALAKVGARVVLQGVRSAGSRRS